MNFHKSLIILVIVFLLIQLTAIRIFYLNLNLSHNLWELSVNVIKDHILLRSDTPELTILCRIFSGSAMEFYNIFLVSYLLFWPYRSWLNSDLVVVLDKENSEDHRFGTILAQLPPFPKIKFEKHDWRNDDYARTIYSSFYADYYSQSSNIGIIDADVYFSTPVTPEGLFFDNNKPRIIGIQGCVGEFCSKMEEFVYDVLGKKPITTFKLESSLPLIVKRQHFADCRQHIIKHLNVSTFEEALKFIRSKYPQKSNQYDIIGHYLWHFKRNDYSWLIKIHINHQSHAKYLTTPLVKDMKFSNLIFKVIYDYVCVGSHMMAGDCDIFERENALNVAVKNLFVDFLYDTGNWKERGIALVSEDMKERPWSTHETSYLQAFQDHKNYLKKRDEVDVWRWRKF